PLGHAYLSAPEDLKADWPKCLEEISKQLPRDEQKNKQAAAGTFEPIEGEVVDADTGGAAAHDGPRVQPTLKPQTLFLGESIAVEYEMTNPGQQPVPYGRGAHYPDLRWNDGFRMSAVRIDDKGKPIGKPVANWPAPENHGGPVGNWELK